MRMRSMEVDLREHGSGEVVAHEVADRPKELPKRLTHRSEVNRANELAPVVLKPRSSLMWRMREVCGNPSQEVLAWFHMRLLRRSRRQLSTLVSGWQDAECIGVKARGMQEDVAEVRGVLSQGVSPAIIRSKCGDCRVQAHGGCEDEDADDDEDVADLGGGGCHGLSLSEASP